MVVGRKMRLFVNILTTLGRGSIVVGMVDKWSIPRAATTCSLRQEGPRKLKHPPNG